MSNGIRHPGRRDFLALGIGALAVATLPRSMRGGEHLVRRQIPVMGTIADVAVRHRDESWAQRAIDAALAELRRVEREMSFYREDSSVGRINARAGGGFADVSLDTGEVLAEALAWARASEGAFDPCLGGVSRLWNVAERREPPAPEDVARMAGSRPYQALEVVSGHAAARVALHEVGSAVDLGGIAKGFGVDMAARALRDQGVFDALVNVGGDLVAMGVGEGDRPWRVGVRSPGSAETIVHTVELSDEAVATSGDYLRFFQHGGRRYHHLMDAREGGPSRSGLQSLTVVASTCMAADAAATTGFVGGTGLLAETIRRVAPGTRVVHSI